jgi:hypothetical protein
MDAGAFSGSVTPDTPEAFAMQNVRILIRRVTALLAMAAAAGLGACGESGTGSSELLGSWRAEMSAGAGQRIEHRLELTPSRYTWTQEVYAPAGRPEDGLLDRFTHSGRWRMEGDRLALRTEAMSQWTYPTGESIIDFTVQWNDDHRIASLQGDRMTVTFEPPPHISFARPPLYFERE